MNVDFLSPKAHVRTDAERWGASAREPIAAGETVAAFGGRCVTRQVLETLPAGERMESVQIDDALYLVPVPGDQAVATVSHSCAPNCGLAGGVMLVAMRDIAPGETLTYDHAMTNGGGATEFDCHCGAPTCRRTVSSNDWMLPELQVAYRGYFSPYLAKRIASLVRTGAERRAFAL